MASQSVWITLQKGSLIVIGESDEVDAAQWLTEEQERAIVQDVHQRRIRPTTNANDGVNRIQPGAPQQHRQTPPDREQEVLGPFGHTDP